MGVKKYNTVIVLFISMLFFACSIFTLLPKKIAASSIPSLSTQSASGVASTVATLNGTITSTGSSDPLIRGFNYGTSTNYGETTAEQTGQLGVGYGTGAYTKSISGLTCATTYHYRSYAVNEAGPGYGSDTTFTTNACNSPTPNTEPPQTNGSGSSSSSEFDLSSLSTIKTSFGIAPFGGKVRLTKIPNVMCEGSGTIFILNSNFTSGTKAALENYATSQGEGGNSTSSKIKQGLNALKALSNTIPYYATEANKLPKVGDLIMGNAKSTPDTSICKLQIGPYRIPFPVKKTTKNYNISGKSKSSSSSGSGSWTGSTYNYE